MMDQQANQLEELVAENQLLKQRVDQMQRLTALGELVSTTTHEFNNVLMTILNYAKMGMRHRDDATRDGQRKNEEPASASPSGARSRSCSWQVSSSTRHASSTVVLAAGSRLSLEVRRTSEAPDVDRCGCGCHYHYSYDN